MSTITHHPDIIDLVEPYHHLSQARLFISENLEIVNERYQYG